MDKCLCWFVEKHIIGCSSILLSKSISLVQNILVKLCSCSHKSIYMNSAFVKVNVSVPCQNCLYVYIWQDFIQMSSIQYNRTCTVDQLYGPHRKFITSCSVNAIGHGGFNQVAMMMISNFRFAKMAE